MVYVKDLPRMRAFYGEMLGVKPSNDTWTDSWTEFDAGGVLFALHAIPPEIASQIEITSPPPAWTESREAHFRGRRCGCRTNAAGIIGNHDDATAVGRVGRNRP